MRTTKIHVPKLGHGAGLRGLALCGRQASYGTADWRQIVDGARRSVRAGDDHHLCAGCAAVLRREIDTDKKED